MTKVALLSLALLSLSDLRLSPAPAQALHLSRLLQFAWIGFGFYLNGRDAGRREYVISTVVFIAGIYARSLLTVERVEMSVRGIIEEVVRSLAITATRKGLVLDYSTD